MAAGSGVGISLYGTHRVAGERYRFAMPETGIGLFPDDGVAWAFARLPDEVGMYLALTGRSAGRADAYRLGLVTHCLPAGHFAEVLGALQEAEPVDPVLDARHVHPGHAEQEALQPAIARCFGGDSVEAIIAALQAERGAERRLGAGDEAREGVDVAGADRREPAVEVGLAAHPPITSRSKASRVMRTGVRPGTSPRTSRTTWPGPT